MTDKFPGCRYGPGGKSAIFESEDDVPKGWVDHPSLVKGQGDVDKLIGRDDPIDAHGHVYDPALHAATQSRTKAGLWRMKVGVSRPDPKPGYPLDL